MLLWFSSWLVGKTSKKNEIDCVIPLQIFPMSDKLIKMCLEFNIISNF